jgi:hypothetical protein
MTLETYLYADDPLSYESWAEVYVQIDRKLSWNFQDWYSLEGSGML